MIVIMHGIQYIMQMLDKPYCYTTMSISYAQIHTTHHENKMTSDDEYSFSYYYLDILRQFNIIKEHSIDYIVEE